MRRRLTVARHSGRRAGVVHAHPRVGQPPAPAPGMLEPMRNRRSLIAATTVVALALRRLRRLSPEHHDHLGDHRDEHLDTRPRQRPRARRPRPRTRSRRRRRWHRPPADPCRPALTRSPSRPSPPSTFWLLGNRAVLASRVHLDRAHHRRRRALRRHPGPGGPSGRRRHRHGPVHLLFADALDGFAGSGYPGSRPAVGDPRRRARTGAQGSDVIAFTVTARHVYALTGHCANGACSELRLPRSPAGSNDWSARWRSPRSASGLPSLTAPETRPGSR